MFNFYSSFPDLSLPRLLWQEFTSNGRYDFYTPFGLVGKDLRRTQIAGIGGFGGQAYLGVSMYKVL